MFDVLISPLLLQGQSLAHIYDFHGHKIPCCRKTLYKYINQSVFSAKNINQQRRVHHKCKPHKKSMIKKIITTLEPLFPKNKVLISMTEQMPYCLWLISKARDNLNSYTPFKLSQMLLACFICRKECNFSVIFTDSNDIAYLFSRKYTTYLYQTYI